MTDKYQFKSPRNAREQIESMSMELRSGHSHGRRPLAYMTVKDLLAELVALHRGARFDRELDEAATRRGHALALSLFASFCLLLIFLGSDTRTSDLELLNDNRFFLRTLGIGLAAVFIGVVIERTEAFGMVWQHKIAKLLASLALSALVIYSAGKASSIINGVFRIDASALPYARALLAGWIAFAQVAKPALLLVALFASSHLLFVLGWLKVTFWPADKDASQPAFPWLSAWIAVLSIIVITNVYHWLFTSLDDRQQPTKVYQMARMLDFNARHACVNVPAGANVVFIGPDQSKVLVDASAEPVLTFKDFIGRPASEWERPANHFPVVECSHGGFSSVPQD